MQQRTDDRACNVRHPARQIGAEPGTVPTPSQKGNTMETVKNAAITTGIVLLSIFVLRKIGPTRTVVEMALQG